MEANSKEKLVLFGKVVSAIDEGVFLAGTGMIKSAWDESEKERRKQILVSARNGNGLVSFNMRTLNPNEVAVVDVKDYSVLIACIVQYLMELGLPDHRLYLKGIYKEEMEHIEPALADPGIEGYQMGIGFVPRRDNRGIGPIGFVNVSGRLKLQTVKMMYANVSNMMSPSDIGMMKLFEELGI